MVFKGETEEIPHKNIQNKNKDFNANQIAQGQKISEDQCCAEYRLYKAQFKKPEGTTAAEGT